MNGKEILSRFGFDVKEEPVSIYPFSPVYRVRDGEQELIVKRTQADADGLLDYTAMLKSNGIDVVTPVSLNVENPQQIGDSNFIVYRFIEGRSYKGTEQEILEAGKLLGKIHQLSPKSNTFRLAAYDVYDFKQDEVNESMTAIFKHASEAQISLDLERLKQVLLESVYVQEELQHAGLPHVATPYDYKANNLVMTPAPYLIDPDNAGWVPRILDLALALLLFHNEHHEAPDRVFTPGEWEVFLSGYNMHTSFTEQEIAFWEKAKKHVFLDEVMWLMAEYEEDWQNPAQQNLFRSLIQVIMEGSDYALD